MIAWLKQEGNRNRQTRLQDWLIMWCTFEDTYKEILKVSPLSAAFKSKMAEQKYAAGASEARDTTPTIQHGHEESPTLEFSILISFASILILAFLAIACCYFVYKADDA